MSGGLCSVNPAEVLIWREIAPRLDDAVLRLSAADRRAIVVRFFEGRSTRELAADLGVSQDAARQRLSRAVARLRKRLGHEESTLPTAAFDALLAALAVRPAPCVLAGIAAANATGAAATGAGITIAKGALTMMTWTKAKISVALVALVAIAATGGLAIKQAGANSDGPKERAADRSVANSDGDGVVASSPPVVVHTVPEAGTTDADPKLTEIKVTFSKPMQDGDWSFVQTDPATFPKTVGKPHFLDDKRTCVLTVRLEPGKGYVIWLNKAPYNSFMDGDGRRAVPYLLVFQTRK